MRRLSRKEKIQEQVRALDAFPKIEPDIQNKSSSGALTTVLTLSVIAVLIVSEFYYYRTTDIVYEYKVDSEMNRGMNLTLDMTIAMKCEHLGADYIDVSGKSVDATKWFKLEPTHFQLAPNQKEYTTSLYARDTGEPEVGLDSLARFLNAQRRQPMPKAIPPFSTPPDSCRVFGTMPIRKVAANFHITAGKSIHHNRGHSHMTNSVPEASINFSHRIDRLSFADEDIGRHTLDGELQTTDGHADMYQYFLKVVPTSATPLGAREPIHSNQYSVTEQRRTIDKKAGSHGIPGIYFKYDLEAISVAVREQRRSFGQFLIRLCGIVGGIFATSGMLHAVISSLFGSVLATPSAPTGASLPSSE